MIYSEPKKNYKGLWESTVKDGDRVVVIVQKTTKKSLTEWIKNDKKERAK